MVENIERCVKIVPGSSKLFKYFKTSNCKVIREGFKKPLIVKFTEFGIINYDMSKNPLLLPGIQSNKL